MSSPLSNFTQIPTTGMKQPVVYGSSSHPVATYSLGTTGTIVKSDLCGTTQLELDDDGKKWVIVGAMDCADGNADGNLPDGSYKLCCMNTGQIVSCPAHRFCVDHVCYVLSNSKIAKDATPNPVKHASIREVSGVVCKKAIDAIATKYAIALAEARQQEDPESDADIAESVTAYVTYDDVEYCFNTDGLLLEARYDNEGHIDCVAVHRESRFGDWLPLDVVQVYTCIAA